VSYKASMTSFTQEELHRLMAYMYEHDRQMHAICLLMLSHGLRRNEVLNLTASNFCDGRILFGRLKGSLPSNHKLIEHSEPVYNEKMALSDVLQIRNDGRVLFDISERQVNRLLVRYCEAVGIHRTKAHCHSFKHTCCESLLPVLGIDGLQKWVGHAEAKNTLKYIRPTDAAIEARLDAALEVTR
jgi:integrase